MSISFSGLASGLDTSSWIKSLTALKQAKVTVLQEERQELVSAKDTLSSIRSFFSSFRSTIEKITDTRFNIATMDLFAQNLAVSSKVEKLTATATHEAEEGKYEIAIDKLATDTKAISSYRYNTTIVESTIATENSLLSSIGVNEGRILITNPNTGIASTIRIEANDTISTFIEKLEASGGGGVNAVYDSVSGKFSINLSASDIVDLDGTNIVNALHLEGVNEGYVSNTLQVQKQERVWETATADTKLADLGTGLTVNNGDTVIVQDSNGNSHTISLNSNSTIGDLLNGMNQAGLNASIDSNGTIEILGGKITGGTFDATSAFGLDEDAYVSYVTGDPLTETIVEYELVTLQTRLHEDLMVKEGFLEVTLADNSKRYLQINAGDTISNLITELNHFGIYATLDESTGILEITGGEFRTMTDAEVQAASGHADMQGAVAPLQSTDLLELLYGAPAINASQTGVAATFARSNPLTQEVIKDIIATRDTTLGELGVNSQQTITLRDRNNTNDLEIVVNANMTLGTLIDTINLSNNGVTATLENGILKIEDGYLDNTVVEEALGLERKITGYSHALGTEQKEIIKVYATEDTLFSQLNIAVGKKLTVHKADGDTADFTVGTTGEGGNGTSLGELFTWLGAQGINASISDGIITLSSPDGHYVDGDVATALDINTTTTTNTHTFGIAETSSDVIKYTTTGAATTDTYLRDIIDINSLTDAQRTIIIKDAKLYDPTADDYGVAIGTFTVSKTATLGDLLDALAGYGIASNIDNGKVTFDLSQDIYAIDSATNGILTTLGINGYDSNVNIDSTIGIISTSSQLVTYTDVVTASEIAVLTELTGLDITATDTLVIKDSNTDAAIGTFTTGTNTVGDLLTWLSENGATASIKDGKITIENGDTYLTGTLAEKLGINQTSKTVGTVGTLMTSSDTVTYVSTYLADGTTKLTEIEGVTAGTSLNVKSAAGDGVIATFTEGTNGSTVADLLNWLTANGNVASINNGRITIENGDRYIDGDLATALGLVCDDKSITYKTVGKAITSSLALTYTGTGLADATTALSDIGIANNKTLVLKNAGGTTVDTFTAGTSGSTLGDLVSWLTAKGNTATIIDGKVIVNNGNFYCEGDIATSLGIASSSSDKTVTTTTVGKSYTGSSLTYSTAENAKEDTRLDELGLNIIDFTLKKVTADGTETSITGIDGATTISGLIDKLEGKGFSAGISDGIIVVTSNDGSYIKGALADKLGIGYDEKTLSEGATIANSYSSSAAIQYNATTSTKLANVGVTDFVLYRYYGIGDGMYGGATHTFESNATIGDLVNKLNSYTGVTASFTDGKLSITVEDAAPNKFVGGVLEPFNITYTETSETIPAFFTSTATVTRTTVTQSTTNQSVDATKSDKVKDLMPNIVNVGVQAIGPSGIVSSYTMTVTSTTTFEQVFNSGKSGTGDAISGAATWTENYISFQKKNDLYAVIFYFNDSNGNDQQQWVAGTSNLIGRGSIETIITTTTTVNVTMDSVVNPSGTGQGTINYKKSDGTTGTITTTTGMTFTQLNALLGNVGLYLTISDGKVTFGAHTAGALITGINNVMSSAVKMPTGAQYTVKYTNSGTGTQKKMNLNENSTFAEIGITSKQTFVKTKLSDGTTSNAEAASSDNIYEFLTSDLGCSVGFADGKITIVPPSGYSITIPDAVKTALNLSGSPSTTTEGGTIVLNDPSDALVNHGNKIAKLTTKLSELNLAEGTYTIKTADGNITDITQNTTIADLITKLGNNGISASLGADGKLTLAPKQNGDYIYSIDAALATALGISSTATDYYSTSTKTVWASETGATKTDAGTKIAHTGITLEQLSLGDGNFIISTAANDITVTKSNTLAELITMLGNNGIAATLGTDGKLTLAPKTTGYIKSIDATLAGVLKLTNSTSNLYSSSTVTVWATETSGALVDGGTKIIKPNILIKDIDSDIEAQKITVNKNNGTAVELTINPGDSIQSMFNQLNAYNIQGSITADGKIVLNAKGEYYITSMGADLRTALKLGSTYHTMNTIYYSTTSDAFTWSDPDAYINYDMTLSEIGINSSTDGTITIWDESQNGGNGGDVTVDYAYNETLGAVLAKLREKGIESAIENGKLKLIPQDGFYIKSDSGKFLEKFKIETGPGKSYETESYDRYAMPTKQMSFSREDILTSETTFDNLTIQADKTVKVMQDGKEVTITMGKNNTLGDFMTALAGTGISSEIRDGKFYILGSENSYITSMDSSIATALKISNSANDYKNTKEITTTLNTNSKSLDRDQEVFMSDSTKLSTLGITSGTITIYQDGTYSTIDINNTNTIAQFREQLAKKGITSEIVDGKLSLNADGVAWLADGTSNLVTKLGLGYNYWTEKGGYSQTSKQLGDTNTVDITTTGDTRLVDLQDEYGDSLGIQEGEYVVVQNGVHYTETIDGTTTVDDFIAKMGTYGMIANLSTNGTLEVGAYNNTYLGSSGTAYATNAIDILFEEWNFTNIYSSNNLEIPQDVVTAISSTTKLSDINEGTYQEGLITIVKDGIEIDVELTANDTVGTLMDTLELYGFNTVINDSGQLTVKTTGNSIIKNYDGTGASNILDLLNIESADWITTKSYRGEADTSENVTTYENATEETLLSDIFTAWGDATLQAQGELAVTVDGQSYKINVASDETFSSLIQKFKAIGIEATLLNGELIIESGYAELNIDEANSTSNIMDDFGLTFHNDLGGYAASNDDVISTTSRVELVDLSVSDWADYGTTLSMLNISSGTLSIYKNGEKATISVDKDETFAQLRSRIATAHAGVDIKFENGYLTFYSTSGDAVEVGATTDTSNIMAVCGLSNEKTGTVTSARELYRVNGQSKLTTAGLFRRGDISEGTFVIGDAEFTIDENTTVNNIISQINSSEEANATATWDSVDGKLVIKSRITGSSLINIEAGTSNFTDIMGWTKSEWNPDGSVSKTRIDVDTQEIGQNASFSINGTHFTSTSNTINSDLSRITGVTINLKEATEGETITLSIERDKESVANAVSDVVDAYNELIENVDKEVAKGADLYDQSTLKLIRNQIRSLMTSSLAGVSIFKNLDQVGISSDAASANNINTDRVNVLTFNKDKFLQAFDADRDALKDLIVGTDAKLGIFSQVENVLESSLAGVYGYFDSASKGYDTKIQRLDTKIEKAQKAVERYTARLEAKFSAMDLLIAKMQNQYSSFLG